MSYSGIYFLEGRGWLLYCCVCVDRHKIKKIVSHDWLSRTILLREKENVQMFARWPTLADQTFSWFRVPRNRRGTTEYWRRLVFF